MSVSTAADVRHSIAHSVIRDGDAASFSHGTETSLQIIFNSTLNAATPLVLKLGNTNDGQSVRADVVVYENFPEIATTTITVTFVATDRLTFNLFPGAGGSLGLGARFYNYNAGHGTINITPQGVVVSTRINSALSHLHTMRARCRHLE